MNFNLKVYNLKNELVSESFFESKEELEKYINMVEQKERPFHQPAKGVYYVLPHGAIEYTESKDEDGNTIYTLPCHYIYNIVDRTEEENKRKRIDEQINKGILHGSACSAVLQYISGMNDSRALTVQQIKKMMEKFSDAENLLRKGMPKTAKQLINSLSADGELITDEMKQDINEIFKRFGL